MKSDTVKLAATYGTAVILAIGGIGALIYVSMQPGIEGRDGLMALLGGFVGSAVTFLFSSDSALRATRAAERSAGVGVGQPMP